ncbi:phosphatase PAP2 family protein [Fictibacillus sp. UD]|uniref:phosphatase PAP2 family protein n=1 Tax=Fictibacillus sp. UD TaxID=3038777 RepID=UPI0037495846
MGLYEKTKTSSLSILVLLITGTVFIVLTIVRNQDPYRSLDESCSRSIYDSKFFSNPFMLFFTRLGSGFFTIPLGVFLFLSFNNTGDRDKRNIMIFNIIGIRLLTTLFKQLFKRTPPEWERRVKASPYGYPSAHAMNAAAFYSLLLSFSGLYKNTKIIAGYIVFLFLIGVSRVKLGVHYVLDVIAGIAGGVFYNLAVIKTYQLFVRR